MDNETWVLEAGGAVIEKKASDGMANLSPCEVLVYCLWVADYSMRNAGDLETAFDVLATFQTDACRIAESLSLPITRAAFCQPTAELERTYFDRFDSVCDEIRRAQLRGSPGGAR